MQEGAQERFLRQANRAAEQDQQIDVGVETEMTAAVSAERQHGHRRLRRRRLGEQLAQEDVGAIRIALERRASTGAAGDIGPQLVPRGAERRRQGAARGTGLGYGRITHALRPAGPN